MTLTLKTGVALLLLFHPTALDSVASQRRGGVTPEHLQQLATAEAKWVQSKVGAYQFRIQPACSGLIPPAPPGILPPLYRVSREKGAQALDGPASGAMDQYNTVEKQFAFIRHALRAKPADVDVEYDQSRGFPAKVCVNPHGMVSDDEYGFLITDFKELSDAGRTP